jgi:hypothetical protein
MAITRTSALGLLGIILACSTAQANISISSKPTQNMSCDAGVCTATAENAVLNVGDLQNMLASGDTAVKTGDLAKEIVIEEPLSWTSSSGLTLDAQGSIILSRPITVSGTAALQFIKHGDLLFRESGKVVFWDLGSSLVINDQPYVLVNTVSGLSTAVAANPSGFFAFASDYNASPDGTYSHPPVAELDGVLNGLGNSIKNLSVETDGRYSSTGLVHKNYGIIRNLNLVDVLMSNQTKIADSAGLVGVNYGAINHCSVSGIVQGKAWFMGGLVSGNNGTITASHSSANVLGHLFAGGLVGNNSGKVIQSYATGNVRGHGPLGGLASYNQSSGSITDSYFTGTVGRDRSFEVGGLVGEQRGTAGISTSYSTGKVLGFAGGVLGRDEAPDQSNAATYWDLDTSGVSDPHHGAGSPLDDHGLRGRTDAELKSGLPTGFNPEIWGSNPNINNGYPYLLANPTQ